MGFLSNLFGSKKFNENNLEEGLNKIYDSSTKKIKKEISIKNGLKNGIYREFCEYDGLIEFEAEYKENELHGNVNSFKTYTYFVNSSSKRFPESKTENYNYLSSDYENGIQHGKTIFYFRPINGVKNVIFRESLWDNGKLIKLKEFNPNGTLKFINKEDEFSFFDEEEKLSFKACFKLSKINNMLDSKKTRDPLEKFSKSLIAQLWCTGLWTVYENNKEIYSLDFNNNKNNLLEIKTPHLVGQSKSLRKFKINKYSLLKFLPQFASERSKYINLNTDMYLWNSGIMGPPGAFQLGVRPIKNGKIMIEDLINLK